jgi:hypothetical protein
MEASAVAVMAMGLPIKAARRISVSTATIPRRGRRPSLLPHTSKSPGVESCPLPRKQAKLEYLL